MFRHVSWVVAACCALSAPAASGLGASPQDVGPEADRAESGAWLLPVVDQPFESAERAGPAAAVPAAPSDVVGAGADESHPSVIMRVDSGAATSAGPSDPARPCRDEDFDLDAQWPEGFDLAGFQPESATTGCSLALMGTCRMAESDQVKVTSCVPCDCPPFGQNNVKLKQTVTTPFLVTCNCDELAMVGYPRSMTIVWTFTQKEVRRAGPCDTPIGSYAGKFVLMNADNNQPIVRGKFLGTLGWDQAHPTCPCQAFPRVIGTMVGKGVPGTPVAGCKVRWIFQGQERYLQPLDLCRPIGWNVGIYGMAICPCP